MAITYLHNFDEISVLNLDKDYLEYAHSDDPQSGNHVSYRIRMSDVYSKLSSEIEKLVKVSKYVEVKNDNIGRIFYQTAQKKDLGDMVSDLKFGNTIPLVKINGKSVVLHSSSGEPVVEVDNERNAIDIYRPDLGEFFGYAERSLGNLLEVDGDDLSVNNGIICENYVYNISSDSAISGLHQCDTLSSQAPFLSGLFPSGNKPMGVTDEKDLVGGCMAVSDEEIKMYVTKQSITIKNGISYTFRASDYSSVYGRNPSESRIFADSVDYVPYIVVKNSVIRVPL